MRHHGDQVIVKEGQTSSASVKKTMREADAEEEKDEHIKQKFNRRAELVNEDVILIMRKAQITSLEMIFYCG